MAETIRALFFRVEMLWLDAACDCIDHFESFKEIILELLDTDSDVTSNCQIIPGNYAVKQHLAIIKTN